jgi:competence protein ComEC
MVTKRLISVRAITFKETMSISDQIKKIRPNDYLALASCLMILTQVALLLNLVKTWPTLDVKLIMCDVGQGDAILIKDRFNYTLVDSGPDNNLALSCLNRHLPWFDSNLDLLVFTHPDNDHIGGAKSILSRLKVSHLMLTPDTKQTAEFEAFRELVLRKKNQGTKLVFPNSKTWGKISQQVEYSVLAPSVTFGDYNTYLDETPETTLSDAIAQNSINIKNYNNRSIVLFLNINNVKVLLTGDIEKETESAIIKSNLLTQVDILKVAHHGSKTSSTVSFLSKVEPEVALISVGKENRFGHPALEVISRLESEKSQVLRTDEHGEVIIKIENDTYKVATKK